MSDDTIATLENLLDREKIRQNIARYARGVDRQDMALVTSTYWPEAWDSHGMLECTGYEFCESLDAIWPTMRMNHTIGQSYIELRGNFANAETYAFAYHRIGEGGATKDVFIGARFADRIEKRGDTWKFIHRAVMYDWYRDVGPSVPWDDSIFPFANMPQQSFGATKDDFSWTVLANSPLERGAEERNADWRPAL
ncbi:nuclear transport factor 2 family protein [Sphingomonas sp. SRS2]|uniref:nuclear transport factor 2 family protein n=1 Tax=Sphingomonas sp. SRS2 TaxID=133190 RepID=UPI00069616C6|nr:nuclear transport factor 2 family protein [Sphingomonas sp. SRS2]